MKKSDLQKIIKEEIQLLFENTWFVAVYSKAKSLDKLRQIVNSDPKNPPIDLTMSPNGKSGPFGTPEDLRQHLNLTKINISGRGFDTTIEFRNGKWSVK